MKRPLAQLPLLATFSLAVAACGGGTPSAAPSSEFVQEVRCASRPVAYLARRIAGGAVPVVCPLPDDADAVSWQPAREDLRAFQRAALIVANGAGFEAWMDSASLPPSRLVRSAHAFESSWLQYESTTHSHGGSGEHTHEGTDGHTWLDPLQADAQAEAILEAMCRAFPHEATGFKVRHAELRRELLLLHGRFVRLQPRLLGQRLLASHPAYNYLARRYEWELENLHLDPGTAPTDAELRSLQEALEEGPALALLWEEEPLPQTAQKLEQLLGLTSLVFSPAEGPGEQSDLVRTLGANLDRLEALLEQ